MLLYFCYLYKSHFRFNWEHRDVEFPRTFLFGIPIDVFSELSLPLCLFIVCLPFERSHSTCAAQSMSWMSSVLHHLRVRSGKRDVSSIVLKMVSRTEYVKANIRQKTLQNNFFVVAPIQYESSLFLWSRMEKIFLNNERTFHTDKDILNWCLAPF